MRAGSTVLVLGVVCLAGCSSGSTQGRAASGDAGSPDRARLAAFAASTEYPTKQAEDSTMTVIVARDGSDIRILNPTNQPIVDSHVWVNGQFVRKVERIPANGTLELPKSLFFNSRGESLADLNTNVSRVQVEDDGKLLNVLGPVWQ